MMNSQDLTKMSARPVSLIGLFYNAALTLERHGKRHEAAGCT